MSTNFIIEEAYIVCVFFFYYCVDNHCATSWGIFLFFVFRTKNDQANTPFPVLKINFTKISDCVERGKKRGEGGKERNIRVKIARSVHLVNMKKVVEKCEEKKK